MIKSLVDLRGIFGPARDQNPRPTCMAFAASDAHAAARIGWNPLSAEWAYYHALKRDGGLPQQGATLDAMLVTIKSDGQPVEAEWPYIKAQITDVTSWKPPAPAKKLFFRDHKTCPLTVQDVIDHLNAGTPVLITMMLSDAFFRPDADGIVGSNEPPDPKRRHAIVAVGHGARGNDCFVLIRNSWGEAWALKGHAWIAINYLTSRLTGAAVMTTEP
jgi:C1A family cysteine protease